MIIYDCEIINAIPPKNDKDRIPGIEYCEGWHDHENMGISCIGVYDYKTDRYHVFLEDNMVEFIKLVTSTDLVIGFNSIHFDNNLCLANGIDWVTENYDILREVWIAAGLPPKFTSWKNAGYGLDAMAKQNLGYQKSGNGALAPVLWQQGKYGEVIDYCLNDVKLTKGLMDKILNRELLRDPKTGGLLDVRHPLPNEIAYGDVAGK